MAFLRLPEDAARSSSIDRHRAGRLNGEEPPPLRSPRQSGRLRPNYWVSQSQRTAPPRGSGTCTSRLHRVSSGRPVICRGVSTWHRLPVAECTRSRASCASARRAESARARHRRRDRERSTSRPPETRSPPPPEAFESRWAVSRQLRPKPRLVSHHPWAAVSGMTPSKSTPLCSPHAGFVRPIGRSSAGSALGGGWRAMDTSVPQSERAATHIEIVDGGPPPSNSQA
jgi:hypothetical protein